MVTGNRSEDSEVTASSTRAERESIFASWSDFCIVIFVTVDDFKSSGMCVASNSGAVLLSTFWSKLRLWLKAKEALGGAS